MSRQANGLSNHTSLASLFPPTGNYAGQDLRGNHRNARVSLTQGLVAAGAAEYTHRQITLSGHLSLSGSLQDG